jgi:decaprenyl-phosphate phosphoribosyltransferase
MSSTAETAARPAPSGGLVRGVIRTARPRQWVKNVLVLAAPFAAFAADPVFRADVVVDAGIAFVAFCLVASAVYLVNDAIDVDADRAHPTKRNRPIAAGIVPVRVAYGLAVFLFLASFAVSLASSWRLLVVIGVYAAVQVGYCLGLKHSR